MSSCKRIVIMAVAMMAASSVLAETVVETQPLRYQDIRGLSGAETYETLCANCHGINGKGDGPAAGKIQKAVPDLTNYRDCNNGSFPHRQVESAIYGRDRDPHDELSMPAWGTKFMYVRYGSNPQLRDAYARDRIHELALHIESLQD